MHDYTITRGKGLVIIMHGLGGTKDQPTVQKLASGFEGKTVVCFDSVFTVTQKYNGFANANYSHYALDLEDFIAFCASQSWYEEPFILAGHSLGGFACVKYAQKYPDKVNGLVLAAPAVDGSLRLANMRTAELDASGEYLFETYYAGLQPINWPQFKTDALNQTVLDEVVEVPTLLLVAQDDSVVPLEFHKKLLEVLPNGDMVVIRDCRHGFSGNFDEFVGVIRDWMRSKGE